MTRPVFLQKCLYYFNIEMLMCNAMLVYPCESFILWDGLYSLKIVCKYSRLDRQLSGGFSAGKGLVQI